MFKFNYNKNPGEFTTNVGLGRRYAAAGDSKKALTNLKAALPKAPDDANKLRIEDMILKLTAGTSIN